MGPPIDLDIHSSMDLLNVNFLNVVFGIVLEGRVTLLHLGPPCSSFSMAFNRFTSRRIRSAESPAGLPNMPTDKQILVETGNALAEGSLRLAQAQRSTGGYFQIEQPATSLMLLLPGFVSLLRDPEVHRANRAVCNDGAPWRKDTAIIANFNGIKELDLPCQGGHKHISLESRAPNGQAWTSIASAYWPGFAEKWAEVWTWAAGMPQGKRRSHLAGWTADSGLSVHRLITESGFRPSGRRSAETISLRIGAGLQPTRRALPTILPEGLGTEMHLQAAHMIPHPFARPQWVPPTNPVRDRPRRPQHRPDQ